MFTFFCNSFNLSIEKYEINKIIYSKHFVGKIVK